MEQGQGSGAVFEYAIGPCNGREGTWELDDENQVRVEAWFKEFQRSKRTHPWFYEGVETNEQTTSRKAWAYLQSTEERQGEEKNKSSMFVPLADTQSLIKLSPHREELWEMMTHYTSCGVIGFYGKGFSHTFKQNAHACMDRSYVVLHGKVRKMLQYRTCDYVYRICDYLYRICDLIY